MELRNRIVGAVGTTALLLGMTVGIASAQTSSVDTSVYVECPDLAEVTLGVGGGGGIFDPIVLDTNNTSNNDTQTAADDFIVTVDMGYYLGPWQVNADITAFVAGPLQFFPGTHFSLGDSEVTVSTSGPLQPLFGPDANDAVFIPAPWAGGTGANAIFETASNWITWWNPNDDFPAPFVSEAVYTGYLDNLPVVPTGNYVAELTVELTTD